MAAALRMNSYVIESRVAMLTKAEFRFRGEGAIHTPSPHLEKMASSAIYPTQEDFFIVLDRLSNALQGKAPVFPSETMDAENFFEEIEETGLSQRQAAVLAIALNYSLARLKKLAAQGHFDFNFEEAHRLWKSILESEGMHVPIASKITNRGDIDPYLASFISNTPVPQRSISPLPEQIINHEDDTELEPKAPNALQPSKFRKPDVRERSKEDEPTLG